MASKLVFNVSIKGIRPKHNARTRMCSNSIVARCLSSYPPSTWDYNSLLSLSSDVKKREEQQRKEEEMIAKVEQELFDHDAKIDALRRLELIDLIQRLGLQQCFDPLIKKSLLDLYRSSDVMFHKDLHAATLYFRLLRQHGFPVSLDVYEKFKDKSGNFKEELQEDVKGLLSLYEASFLGFEEDHIMDEAKAFATEKLKEIEGKLSPSWARKVEYALDMPWHWRVPRLEARYFIENYAKEQDHDSTLLQLSKLHYNVVQSRFREEAKALIRWWVELDLRSDKQSNARDRVLEHFLWAVCIVDEPQYSALRLIMTKLVCMLTAIDDIYDIYGTIPQLQLLTNLICRWEVNGIDELPEFMKKSYLALYNVTNDIGFSFIKEKGFNIIPFLSNGWGNLCTAYMKEAQWKNDGYDLTLTEHLENGIIFTSGAFTLATFYFLTTNQVTEEAVQYIEKPPEVVKHCSTIVRLINDLGTFKDEMSRGDTLKSIQCYMNETGASLQAAEEHMKDLIFQTWKKLNHQYYESCHRSPLANGPVLAAYPNLARASHYFYHHGEDRHGNPDALASQRLNVLLFEPLR